MTSSAAVIASRRCTCAAISAVGAASKIAPSSSGVGWLDMDGSCTEDPEALPTIGLVVLLVNGAAAAATAFGGGGARGAGGVTGAGGGGAVSAVACPSVRGKRARKPSRGNLFASLLLSSSSQTSLLPYHSSVHKGPVTCQSLPLSFTASSKILRADPKATYMCSIQGLSGNSMKWTFARRSNFAKRCKVPSTRVANPAAS
mmetsp:Transcript_24889/g.45689  ORF Transcript_24889/g.45689 Transcript_24889/m.45689 type:complete len:201 (-) Transcript_24889:921-1523(-)